MPWVRDVPEVAIVTNQSLELRIYFDAANVLTCELTVRTEANPLEPLVTNFPLSAAMTPAEVNQQKALGVILRDYGLAQFVPPFVNVP